MKALIGYTGFVGSNLIDQTSFDKLYNSKNINEIKGENFSSVICAGAPAVKWYANKHPKEDFNTISSLMDNLKSIKSDEFILISTVDVYNSPLSVNESSPIDSISLQAYGKNRLMLENFVKENFDNHLIIRLPGLFGKGLKKNIIYDFLHNNNINQIDSRNVFQFYNLERLYNDIQICKRNNLKIVNFGTEPISVSELIFKAFGRRFVNELSSQTVNYNMQTLYNNFFDNDSSYLASKKDVIEDLRKFIAKEKGDL